MNDNDLRNCMRDISDDLVKEAEMLAPFAAGNAADSSGVNSASEGSSRSWNSNSGLRRFLIPEIIVATIALVAALTVFAIYKIVDNNRRSREPAATAVISTRQTSAPTAESAGATPKPTPTPMPVIDSAVEFLNRPDVIKKITSVYGASFDKDPDKIEPGNYYVGRLTANYRTNWPYRLLKLDREQSYRILSAADITGITYIQSECLPLMLSWDRVSVIDDYSLSDSNRAYRAFYYYLDDSTVIIVNDGAKAYNKAYKNDDSAWILVIPKGEEPAYPFGIPPEGTFVSYKDHDPETYDFYCSFYYEKLRAYFMRDSEFVEIVKPAFVYPDYMTDYTEWITWRTSHPQEYEQWKQCTFPQKHVEGQGGRSYFKLYSIKWLSSLNNGKEPPEAEPIETAALPYFYLEIKQYGIPEEELLEFVNWQNWTDYYREVLLSKEDVELLYTGNEDQIRRRFVCDERWYHNGVFYSIWDVVYSYTPYEIAVIFTPESFNEFMEQNNMYYYLRSMPDYDEERLARILGAWDEYERISKEDAGELTAQSAERELTGFMEVYRKLRYSPEAMAGEPAGPLYPVYFKTDGYGEYFYTTDLTELYEQIRSVFTPKARLGVYSLLETRYSGQFYYCEADDGNVCNVISTRPVFYNGVIELFDDSFRLADNIKIVSSDPEHAEAELTARKRGGEGILSYSVEFAKVDGKWYISGGTVFDLISAVS